MWTFSLCAISLLAVAPLTLQQNASAPLVQTTLGPIQGIIMKTQKGADILAFRGIPYAKAPVDDLRFRAPVAVSPWNETLLATSDSLVCPQDGLQALMSEDCLKLNVFTRNLTGKVPVLVYIHGGANTHGSGHSEYEAGPQYLLDHDVVLVALNYRLGALGFLSTKSSEAPGNFGYLDQVLALQWVQQHIEHFGGDPQQMTIFGISAGSMAVTLHMASPLSKGLFHRAIAMSGATTNHFVIDNQYWTRKLAREVACPMYNPKDLVDCLRNVTWETIIDVCTKWEPYQFINMKWHYEIDNHFLVEHPTDAFLNGRVNKVPLMAGITRDELDFTVFTQENNTGLLNDISLNFGLYAPEFFLYQNFSEQPDPDDWRAKRINSFYLNSLPITQSNLQQFGQIVSDALGSGVHRLVQLYSKHGTIYYYRTDYVGERSIYTDAQGKPRGVCHGDDLQYIMPGSWFGPELSLDSKDKFMVERLTRWFTNFAKTGIPTDKEDTEAWLPCSDDKIVTLYNNKNISMGDAPYQERYQLWDNIFPIAGNSAKQLKLSALVLVLLVAIRNFL